MQTLLEFIGVTHPMQETILFPDATDASAVKDFISNFAKQHCLIVNHMRKKCVSHLRDLIDCGGRLRVAIVPACLAEDTSCFNLVGVFPSGIPS